ncbi:MAG: murein L,D-transpeptidase family protein [Pseudomonadota bacterium]
MSEFASDGVHLKPVPYKLVAKMDRLGMAKRSPILMRIFKEESALEVWKRDTSGRYTLLKEYEICAWSGKLGPKLKEGDRQAPEGFYNVGPGQMNPNSSFHLAFNIGFPNQFDRSLGRTGSHLMVHGDCSSRGCYAMEDDQIEEIYALAREAFRGGQSAFQIQAFPFRMTAANLARHQNSKHIEFWRMLKEGSDHFEVTGQAPRVDVCGGRYVFNAVTDGRFEPGSACPAYSVPGGIEQLVAAKAAKDTSRVDQLMAKAANREARQERWAERERAIAAFFDRSRSGEDEPVAAPTAVVASAVPIPRRAPQRPKPSPEIVAATGGNWLRRERQPAPPEPAAPLAYAETPDNDGFFSGVAKGSRGLFRRATSVFK